MLIDSHCHLQFKSFDQNRDEVIARCIEKGMVMNTIGTQMATSKKAVALANKYEPIYATVGLHPIQSKQVSVEEEEVMFVAKGEDFDTEYYEELVVSSDKVIAIGETGLDAFHVPDDIAIEKVFDDQWELFQKHVALANKYNLPIVIHTRDGKEQEDGSRVSAHKELIKRLSSLDVRPLAGAVVHCFTGNWQEAEAYLEMGFYLGFTGVVTFPPKKTDPEPQIALQEVIEKVPLDRVLVETDAPFLAPQAYRGKQSEPWMTEEVVKYISNMRGVEYDLFRKITVENTKKIFTKI